MFQIIDFSEAERNGFISAFVEFWSTAVGNQRTQAQLIEAAKTVIRGCQQHFRASVTRLKRNTAVVPPKRATRFQQAMHKLLDIEMYADFLAAARAIMKEYPGVKGWLSWWMREAHASMLFRSQTHMDAVVWDRIPDSTNAEEAMHWKIYASIGKDHDLLPGVKSLYAFAHTFYRLNAAASGMFLLL